MSWRLTLLTIYGALFLLAFYPIAFSWEYRQALTSTATLGVLLVALSWGIGVAWHWRRTHHPPSWRRGV